MFFSCYSQCKETLMFIDLCILLIIFMVTLLEPSSIFDLGIKWRPRKIKTSFTCIDLLLRSAGTIQVLYILNTLQSVANLTLIHMALGAIATQHFLINKTSVSYTVVFTNFSLVTVLMFRLHDLPVWRGCTQKFHNSLLYTHGMVDGWANIPKLFNE